MLIALAPTQALVPAAPASSEDGVRLGGDPDKLTLAETIADILDTTELQRPPSSLFVVELPETKKGGSMPLELGRPYRYKLVSVSGDGKTGRLTRVTRHETLSTTKGAVSRRLADACSSLRDRLAAIPDGSSAAEATADTVSPRVKVSLSGTRTLEVSISGVPDHLANPAWLPYLGEGGRVVLSADIPGTRSAEDPDAARSLALYNRTDANAEDLLSGVATHYRQNPASADLDAVSAELRAAWTTLRNEGVYPDQDFALRHGIDPHPSKARSPSLHDSLPPDRAVCAYSGDAPAQAIVPFGDGDNGIASAGTYRHGTGPETLRDSLQTPYPPGTMDSYNHPDTRGSGAGA